MCVFVCYTYFLGHTHTHTPWLFQEYKTDWTKLINTLAKILEDTRKSQKHTSEQPLTTEQQATVISYVLTLDAFVFVFVKCNKKICKHLKHFKFCFSKIQHECGLKDSKGRKAPHLTAAQWSLRSPSKGNYYLHQI